MPPPTSPPAVSQEVQIASIAAIAQIVAHAVSSPRSEIEVKTKGDMEIAIKSCAKAFREAGLL